MIHNSTTHNLVSESEIAFQQKILSGVARTFALTTPQLPTNLKALFGNVYLLCRINDTIEDDPELTVAQKDTFARRFVSVVTGENDDESFGQELAQLLSSSTLASEKELINHTTRVVNIKRQFSPLQQKILERCVSTMSRGMVEFQRNATVDGLADLSEFNRYCYSVAGIVGETMTELMCDHSDEVAKQRDVLIPLAISFGQGLQMINILKDTWEDRARGVCWLPRDIFLAKGIELGTLEIGDTQVDEGIAAGMSELIAIANYHLLNAQRYIEMIPSRESGYRRYCLWAAGMALATLRQINKNPNFKNGNEVKISRSTVRTIIVLTSIFSRSNRLLGKVLDYLRRDLPSVKTKDGRDYIAESALSQHDSR